MLVELLAVVGGALIVCALVISLGFRSFAKEKSWELF
jgi:hypothetical protein